MEINRITHHQPPPASPHVPEYIRQRQTRTLTRVLMDNEMLSACEPHDREYLHREIEIRRQMRNDLLETLEGARLR